MKRARSLWLNGLLMLVLLLALGLRLYRIQVQSLWNDEGTSVALAARDLEAITKGAANDIHPPLYYFVLHFWIGLFGNSELAVRSLSALTGTLLVLLTYALSRFAAAPSCSQDAANRVGLLAAFFTALSPFQIYYSQETRMYILSALFGALSMYVFVRILAGWQSEAVCGNAHNSLSRRIPLILTYVTATILLLYTHYFAASIVVVQNLVFLCWLVVSWRSTFRYPSSLLLHWVTLQTIVVAAYLPWVVLAAGQLRAWPAISEPIELTTLLIDLLRVFSLGVAVAPRPHFPLIGFAALLLAGIVAPSFRPPGEAKAPDSQVSRVMPHVMSMLYLFVPIAMMYMLSLRRPMYDPKFLLLCTPPFHLFLAQGAIALAGGQNALWQGSPTPNINAKRNTTHVQLWLRILILLVGLAFVAVSSLSSLHAYYFDARYARDDYRSIAQYIEAVEQENDAVLINAPGQIETFSYYYRGKLTLYPLPHQRPLDEGQTEVDLQRMTQGRARIFAVLWATDESDPKRFIEGWLDQHTYKAMDSWYGNVRFVVYAVPLQPKKKDIQYPMRVKLGGQVHLLGYNLLTTEVMPGDILQLTLFWQAVAPINERYKVFTHVVDRYGHLVGQRDAEPGGGAKITTIWKEGEQVIDNYGLPILPATPPGEYMVEIGMYRLEDGQRLPVVRDGQAVGDHILLQPVRVLPAAAPPPLSVLGMTRQLGTQFEAVTLLGYDLAKLGYEHQPDAPVHPGDIVHLTLFWQANRRPAEDLVLVLQLQDGKGDAVRLERRGQPTEGQYPALQWRPGEIIRDQHSWPLPSDLRPAHYRIYLSVQRLPSNQPIGTRLLLASLSIK